MQTRKRERIGTSRGFHVDFPRQSQQIRGVDMDHTFLICQPWLRVLVDVLHSISLRTLRYVRLGFVATPQSVRTSLKVWRALQKAAVKRDNKLLLSLAASRLDDARDAAIRAVAAKPADGRRARAPKAAQPEVAAASIE